jgi:hypothetical protein
VFVEENPTTNEQEITDGIDKMLEDITGKPAEEATPAERKVAEQVAQEIHERNLRRPVQPDLPPTDGTFFNEAEESKWFNANITKRRVNREAEARYQEWLKRPKTIDQLADEGAFTEGKDEGVLRVEVSPGNVREMTQEQYEQWKNDVLNGSRR